MARIAKIQDSVIKQERAVIIKHTQTMKIITWVSFILGLANFCILIYGLIK